MSHTPGPWEITTRLTFGWDVKVKDRDWLICGLCFEDDDDKKADAHLIAAAPELLEALEELYHLIDDAHDGDRVFTFELAQKAKTAIAKARGQG